MGIYLSEKKARDPNKPDKVIFENRLFGLTLSSLSFIELNTAVPLLRLFPDASCFIDNTTVWMAVDKSVVYIYSGCQLIICDGGTSVYNKGDVSGCVCWVGEFVFLIFTNP